MGGRLWTDGDLDYLRQNLGKVSLSEIAAVLNRTEGAVIQRAYDIGISHKLDTSDSAFREVAVKRNATKRGLYNARLEQGLCTMCGKRWAETGRRKCPICRERAQKWWRDNDMTARTQVKKNKLRAERKEQHLCTNCGKPLERQEIGINSQCSKCRKKDMERTTVKRIRDRIHGIPRKR